MRFTELAERFPETLSPAMLEAYQAIGSTPIEEVLGISSSADFSYPTSVDLVESIGPNCRFGRDVVLGRGLVLGGRVEVDYGSILADDVHITENFFISRECYFGNAAGVAPSGLEGVREYIRIVRQGSTIGNSVVLPGHVQLGAGAIVPRTASVKQIGPYGTQGRMMTVYGSSDGPRCSFGENYGLLLKDLEDTLADAVRNDSESAYQYMRNITQIKEASRMAQHEFERNPALIDELLHQRREAFEKAAQQFERKAS